MQESLIARFAKLFRGYEAAHGQHILGTVADENGKIKGEAKTLGAGARLEDYKIHLSSRVQSLGIIPLMTDNRCAFGAIDIDIQGEVVLKERIEELEARIRGYELPLVVFRSKSGGAHCYMFCDPPVPAPVVQAKLTEFASLLGYAGCEVFPKQVVRADETDRGNWINIAMQGCLSEDGTIRWCCRAGKPIKDLGEFLDYADQMIVSPGDLAEFKVKMNNEFNEAPPCLQHLATFGIGDGSRNVTLSNFAVLAKMMDLDNWQDLVQAFNYKYIVPPLASSEVGHILKSMTRKEYFYTCKKPPLVQHCNRKACVLRRFGIAVQMDANPLFQLDNLTKHISKDEVTWYVEFQGARVHVSTEDLLAPTKLQIMFLEKFNVILPAVKKPDWMDRLKELINKSDEVMEPEDASFVGQVESVIDQFLTETRPAEIRDELMKGNPVIEGDKIYFRSADVMRYLGNKGMRMEPKELWHIIKEQGGETKLFKIHGKVIRTWGVPKPQFYDGAELALPKPVEDTF